MPKSKDKVTKLAPIFGFKTNKVDKKIDDKSDANKRLKRKKKSPKNENKNKTNNFDSCCGDNGAEDEPKGRRSKRLRNKEMKSESIISYNEDSDEEIVCHKTLENSEDLVNKLDDSVLILEENSNTIDYWSDLKSGPDIQIDSADDDIEVITLVNPSLSQQTSQSSQVTLLSSNSESEVQKERLLWTEKYKPTNSSEVIGHKVAVNRLKSWLEDWGKSDQKKSVFAGEEDSDNCLDETNACLLICGPTGSGKTSMVYAIAEELKYEVLELNASMKRNGRIISKILGEATQSHHMQRNNDSNGSTPSIHSFFSSVSNSVVNRVDDIKVVKQSKKVKPKGILNYFSKQNSVKNVSKSEEIEVIEEKIVKKPETQTKCDSVVKTSDRSNDCSLFTGKALSIATKSLILFDDIDVMIDDDFIGFWNAFNRINEMTRKPVILTATQYVPYIKNCVNRLQTLTLNKPNASETIQGIKRVLDNEIPLTEEETSSNREEMCQHLSIEYDCDIRRCLNQLQFGTESSDVATHRQVSTDKKLDIDSYYESLLLGDVMETQFGILSPLENRDNWMKCKPFFMENESQSITLTKDIVDSVNQLNHNINKRSPKFKELCKPIDNESIESIYQFLSPNSNLKTVLLDYCPYLGLMCDSECVRQLQIANHSRRSRRFMHHFDSIGFYIDNVVKTKLISAFVSQESKGLDENIAEESDSGHKLDEYFYE